MARVKVDWTHHQKEFERQKKESPSLTVQEYCDSNGLSFSSAKRYIKSRSVKTAPQKRGRKSNFDYHSLYDRFIHLKMIDPSLSVSAFAKKVGAPVRNMHIAFKKIESEKGSKGDDSNDQNDVNDVRNCANESAQTGNKKPIKNKGKETKKRGGRNARQTLRNMVEESERGTGIGAISHRSNSAISHVPERDGYGRLLPGNKLARIHGGYVKLAELDLEIVQAVQETALTDVSNELIAARAQLLSMHQWLSRSQRKLIERYENGDPKTDENGNVIPLEQEIGRLLFGVSERFRTLEGSISNMAATAARIEHDATKLRQKAWELPALSASQIAEITAEIMDTRNKEEWSATRTAQEFERLGIKVPAFLMIEARKEIEEYEPPVDDNGMSDDELDEISRAYMEKQGNTEQWLEQRRIEVQEAIESAEAREMQRHAPEAEQEEGAENDDGSIEDMDLSELFDDLDGFEEIPPEDAV